MPRVWTGASMIPILDGRVGVYGPRRGTARPFISKDARARGPKLCISNCGQTRWPTDHPAFPACDDPEGIALRGTTDRQSVAVYLALPRCNICDWLVARGVSTPGGPTMDVSICREVPP